MKLPVSTDQTSIRANANHLLHALPLPALQPLSLCSSDDKGPLRNLKVAAT